MGLFGIKKANEEPKNNNTFINQDVINAADYSNMPNNQVVGYNQPAADVVNNDPVVMNYDMNNYNNGETFVYTQVDSNQYNNQFNSGMVQETELPALDNSVPVQQNYYDQSMYSAQTDMNPVVGQDGFVSANTSVPVSDVVVTVDNNFSQVAYPEMSTNQEFSGGTQVPFDNSALFALPAGAVVEEEPVVEEVVEEDVLVEEEPQILLDPLDNANNPVPVNPVAPKEEKKVEVVEEELIEEIPLFDEEEEVKTNLFTVINMMVGVIIKPGSTISLNARKYKKIFNALTITFWVTMLSFVMSLAGRILAGCFSKTENAISGASKIILDFTALMDTNNYVPYLLITLLIGLVAIIVVALVYYISSFICSKGIHIGTYFAISTLSIVPIIIGFTLLHPIVNILSSGMALMVLIFSIIYALIILFTGMNQVLKFKNNDGRIIYNAINIAVIFSVMVFIFSTLSKLNILDLVMFL